LVRSQTEFDFEAPADVNGVPNDSGDSSGKNNDGEENDRLTMRDAILARVNDGVKITKTLAGHYNTLYTPLVANTVTVPVTRGWVAADVTFHKKQFRLVNTHFEAFDSQATGNPTNHNTTVNRGEIREAQANQLVGPHGPTKVNRPVILIGDLNSDDDTVQDGDQLAYNAITAAGFRERSTSNPLGCCLNTSILTPASNGSVSDFDHQVDHILTNKPRKVQLVSSSVTGRSPHNDIWDSDHAGLFSALRLR